jgi:HAD superfamily hydrolase (TIGR01509 family)
VAALPFDAVLFDCDGVLVDSEPITARVIADMLAELGWPLGQEEAMRLFVGKAVRDELPMIRARTGADLGEAWLASFRARRDEALAREVDAIAGAPEAVRAVHAASGGRIAVASGADRGKVELQLGKIGLLERFAGRVFSGQEQPRNKPHPDVYLAAARGLGADPARCAVVEDTVTGASAGVAAGATVFGYSPGGPGHAGAEALREAGVAQVFQRMEQLPQVLAAWSAPPS